MLTLFIDKIADKIRWGYLTAFILLLVSYILTFYSTQQVLNQQKRVNHTSQVVNTVDVIIFEVKDAESATRGYILTKDERFLVEAELAKKKIDSTYRLCKQLTAGNPSQQQQLDSLYSLIGRKVNLMTKGAKLLTSGNAITNDTLRSMANENIVIMDGIKSIGKKLQAEENAQIARTSDSVYNLTNFIKVINVASIVIAIALAFYSLATFNKENRARQRADEQAMRLRQQLEERINDMHKVNTELLELRSIEKFAVTGRISRTIAHEVRNPLTNINLATEHLRTEFSNTSETNMLLDMVSRNSNRINELINDLLNSTKAAPLDFSKVDINELLDKSLSFAQDRVNLKSITVKKNYTPNLKPVLADPEKLNIAFLNIIVNAIEATEPGIGVITISTQNKNNRAVIIISDNGKGMDKESLGKLFEPYFTTKEKGTGLGLTNTQNIIFSHQGKVYAESEPGHGSSFIISLNYA